MAISMIASGIIGFTSDSTNAVIEIINILFILLCFGAITVLKFVERGQFGENKQYIYRYEISKLEKIINEMEKSFVISEDSIAIEWTRQLLIIELINKRKHAYSCKKKKNLEEQIERVTKLNVSLDNIDNYKLVDIKLGGKTCKIAYDSKKGKENNYIGELNLKTRECSILYNIMNENGLCEICTYDEE